MPSSDGHRPPPAQPPRGQVFGLPAWVLCLGIVGLTAATYAPVFDAAYVWNDVDYVTRSELRGFHGLWRIWFDLGATEQYYPLLHSAFWVEHHLWGDAALGYHLANILLHATSACLLAFALRRLAAPGSWLAAGIFALHPVCVESVAWISEQKNTLSTVLFLAAGLIYLHYDQTRRRNLYWFATAVFVLALLSKSLTATLPPALLVIFWWQRGRLEWRRDVRPLLPWFVLGAAVGLFTAWFEHTYIGARGPEFALTLGQRCLVAGRAIWFYLGKTLWPADLIFFYPRWTVDTAAEWQYLFPLGVLALLGGLWWVRGRWRGPLAAMLFFTGTLFPVMGFFNLYAFRYSFVADHWQYLPMIGIIVPLAFGLVRVAGRIPALPPMVRAGLALFLLGALGAMSWSQAWSYRNEETLYRVTLERHPACWQASNNLAEIRLKAGRLSEAIALVEEALRLNPNMGVSHYNLGVMLLKLPDRFADARAHFQKAAQINPRDARARHNYGFTLVNVPGRRPEAIAEYQAALRLKPDYPEACNNLGSALLKEPGRQAEAIAQFETALRLKPDFADARFNLALALLKQPGRQAEAISQLQEFLRLQPADAEAHNKLGEIFLQSGRALEAYAHFQTAVRLKPDYRAAKDNLAKLVRPDTNKAPR